MKVTPSSISVSLSELEGSVLALIRREASCTPYFVRDVFRRSPADFWSGSAGSIYPLITRLTSKGLLTAIDDQTGRRKRKLYSPTPAGETALRGWLSDVERGASLGFDPMRTRLHYAGLYGPSELRAYAAQVLAHMKNEIPAPQSEDPKVPIIHEIWLSHRQAAIEKILGVLEEPIR